MSANKRPHINIAAVRGIRHIVNIARSAIQARPKNILAEKDLLDAERGLTYLDALCDWFENPHV